MSNEWSSFGMGHGCCGGHSNEEDDGWPVYDAKGIYLTRVCEKCEKEKLGAYRPEILSGYTQDDVDEPIEGEEW